MQQTDPTTATTIGIVQRYNESFNQGDVDGVMAAMTGDCVVETPILRPTDLGSRVKKRSGPCGRISSNLRPTSSSPLKTCSPVATGAWSSVC